MKILWITCSIFPAPSKVLGLSDSFAGGWMFALAKQLASVKEIKLAVATVYAGIEIRSFDIEDVLYYLVPSKSWATYQKSLESCWQEICGEFRPDVIHIHGTEYTPGLACMRSCPTLNFVFSIQGIVGVCSRYYLGGISFWEICKNITFRDLLRRDSLWQANKKFKRRSILEKEYFLKSHHVIGRTSWDYIHSITLNPLIKYHFCNEPLRESFYTAPGWNIHKKTDHTIFLSRSEYPLKGLHQVLKAVALLRKDYPEIKIRVAGPDILKNDSFTQRIRLSGYGAYIHSLILNYKLNGKVVFTGILNEAQMVDEYLGAHLFICPSSIENSPNSLGEAQILGVPCIASYAGGIPDMITHGESGLLYRFEEIEMLAYYIRQIFEDNVLAMKLSEKGKEVASKRHNKEIIKVGMYKIYESIINCK